MKKTITILPLIALLIAAVVPICYPASGPKPKVGLTDDPCCFPNVTEMPWGSRMYWALDVLQGDWENWSTMSGEVNKDFSAFELDNKGPDGREAILRLQAWPGSDFLMVRTNNVYITLITGRGQIWTSVGVRVNNPDGLVLNCPDGGSFILRVANDGSLSTSTNVSGL